MSLPVSRPGGRRAARRCRDRIAPPAACAAAGWQLGTACLVAAGTVVCPLCAVLVAARPVAAGVVEVAAHPPADAVTCGCGTVHARLACPGCGRPTPAADALLHGHAFTATPLDAAEVRS
jgi:hypothetical protein